MAYILTHYYKLFRESGDWSVVGKPFRMDQKLVCVHEGEPLCVLVLLTLGQFFPRIVDVDVDSNRVELSLLCGSE